MQCLLCAVYDILSHNYCFVMLVSTCGGGEGEGEGLLVTNGVSVGGGYSQHLLFPEIIYRHNSSG